MAGKAGVKILVVEDNPAVRELLRKSMEVCGEVMTAADGADGLLKAIETQPDVIVSDYLMPGLDGLQLYEKLRSRKETRKTPFIFLASKGDIDEKLRQFTDGVEDFIPKPFFVHEIVSRTKKLTDRLLLEKLQTTARRPGVIEGLLEEMSVLDLFQSLEMGQKSCRLTVTRGKEKCEVWFEGGQVYDAQLGKIAGDEAVFKIAGWEQGSFEIDFSGKSSQRRTTRSTQALLMEGLQMLDEARAQRRP
jgi:CheY-like chemotaxis protein